MAKDVERMVVEISADVSRLERGLKAGAATTARQARIMEARFEQMNQRTTRSVSMMTTGIGASLTGLALGAAIREIGQYADAWTRASNSLRASGLTVAATSDKMSELVALSLRSRSSLEGTVTLYNRLTAASSELGVSQAQVARVVETVNKALATSNMTQGERASAVTQLAQGLGSGNLAGDELKAIRENSQVLAQAIADEFGVTIGELKKLGAEGELTSVRVFAAIEKASGSVDSAFGRTRATIDDALTNLKTRTIEYIGTLDTSTGASAKFASVVEFVANNLGEIAEAAGYVAVAVGGAYVTALTVAAVRTALATASSVAYQVALMRMAAATAGTTTAQIALNAALTANPIGLVVTAVAALTAGIIVLGNAMEATGEASRDVKQANDALKSATDAYAEAAEAASIATGKEAVAARQAAAEKRALAIAARDAAQAKLSEAAATVALIQAEAGRALQREMNTPLRAMSEGSTQLISQADLQRLRNAEASAAASRKSITDANAAIAQATAAINRRAPSGGGGGGGGGGGNTRAARGASGPSPAELAAQRETLRLEGELAVARANANEAEEKRLQRLLDIRTLTEQMTRAQVQGAEAAATAQVDAVIAGEALQKQIDDLIAASEKRTEARIAAEQAIEDELDRQLQTQIELARIEGNDRVVLMLERELQLRQALNALGAGATPDQRQTVRDDEAMLNRAEDRAMVADQGKEMARNFVDIVRSDDIGTELGNRFRAAAFDKLEEVIGNLFSQIMQGQQGGNGGGIGGALMTAVGSLFGGRRALGGPVRAGMAYQVNENTPNSEFFVPKSDGWVGNIKAPRGQRSQQVVNIRQGDLYLAGANGDSVIYANVRRMLDQSQRQTVAAVKAGAPSAQLENTLLRE